MNETRVRYIAVILISVQAIFLFALYSLIFVGMRLSYMSIEGNRVDADIIIAVYIFLGIGVLVILSAFYKTAFYVLTGIKIAAGVLLSAYLGFFYALRYGDIHNFIISGVILLIFLSPEIFYYTYRVKILCKSQE